MFPFYRFQVHGLRYVDGMSNDFTVVTLNTLYYNLSNQASLWWPITETVSVWAVQSRASAETTRVGHVWRWTVDDQIGHQKRV